MRLYPAVPKYKDSGNSSRGAHYRATLRYSIPRNLWDVGISDNKLRSKGSIRQNCGRRSLAPLGYQYWLGVLTDNHLCAITVRLLHRDAHLVFDVM